MSVLTADMLQQTTGGAWLARASSPRPIRGVEVDSRAAVHDRAFIAIRGERHDGHRYVVEAVEKGASMIVVDRPIEADLNRVVDVLRVDDTRGAMGKMAKAFRESLGPDVRVIAITGTAGKTSTKAMLHSILSKAMPGHAAPKSFNNDIGVPLTLLNVQPEHRYVIVEIGTNSPGEIGHLASIAQPDIAIITMVGCGHLAGLGTVEAVAVEKLSLLKHVRNGGAAIVPDDLSIPHDMLRRGFRIIRFGDRESADVRLRGRRLGPRYQTISLADDSAFALALAGVHNAHNALAAIAAARTIGLADEAIERGLSAVRPPPMRFEMSRIGRLTLINDAYNANPQSMHASIETFIEVTPNATHRVLVLGDMRELGDRSAEFHRALGGNVAQLFARGRIHSVLLIGRQMTHAREAIAAVCAAADVEQRSRVCKLAEKWLRARVHRADALLLKGSRGMELERFMPMIEQIASRMPLAPAPAGAH